MMDIIWLLPILCLSGSILYCSVRLWLMYKEEIHIRAHRVLEQIGLWKTGKGRWSRLKLYGLCYMCSAIISTVISITIFAVSKKEVIEELMAYVGRLSIVEIRKFVATVGFAGITVLESLLMYERDFSNVDCESSKSRKFLRYLLWDIFPILVWAFWGLGVYKDYFLRTAHEWISSPGRVFQLCWGGVSIIIFGPVIFSNLLNKEKNYSYSVESVTEEVPEVKTKDTNKVSLAKRQRRR